MGILKEPADMVRALRLPKGFSVCELGDQMVSGKVATPAVEFYRSLGCGRYEAIDGNGRGTLIADLNLAIYAAHFDGGFDLVTDFGTGEHIFDQAQVWRTLHDLTKVGGFIAFDRPAQGYPAHCFYLVTESWCRDIAAANNYRVVRLELGTTPRGQLWRGVFQRTDRRMFKIPQQGRYAASLKFGRPDGE